MRDGRHSSLWALVVIALGSAVPASADAAAAPERGAAPTVTVTAPMQLVPGPSPVFRWPASGEAAVAVAGVGLVGESPDERRVPIASLTKMMTALVVLRDHPLAAGAAGPGLVLNAFDVADWKQHVKAGDSAVEVQAGEVISEYQALEALLIPSGDNIADRLAVWDAGSIGAFVAKMNRLARVLGLASTRYVDASGVDPGSAGTAADQALLASNLMASPVVRGIVRQQSIDLPVVGALPNRNPALAIDGIIGVKGGYSSHAHHCLVTAAFRSHHAALVISVALGQPDALTPARIDEALLRSVTMQLDRRRLLAPDALVGSLAAAVGGTSGPRNLVAPSTPPAAVVWPGLALSEAITLTPGRSAQALESAPAGAVVGVLTISAPWGILASVPIRVGAAAPRRPGTPDRPLHPPGAW